MSGKYNRRALIKPQVLAYCRERIAEGRLLTVRALKEKFPFSQGWALERIVADLQAEGSLPAVPVIPYHRRRLDREQAALRAHARANPAAYPDRYGPSPAELEHMEQVRQEILRTKRLYVTTPEGPLPLPRNGRPR